MDKRFRRKREREFKRGCVGKKRYQYGGEARAAARELQAVSGEPMGSYYCVFCQGFHVGHVNINR